MVKIVLISRFGETRTLSISSFNYDELYKKCKFRKSDDFEKRHTWKLIWNNENIFIQLFSKDNGRATSINKYELPPPLEKEIYYGCMALVATSDVECQSVVNLTTDQWQILYEKLHGGFEDLEDEDTSEEEFIPPALRAQHGYSKEDNFIMNDDEDIEYDTPSQDSEDEYDFENDSDEEDEYLPDDNGSVGGGSVGSEEIDNEGGIEAGAEDDDDDVNSELEEEGYLCENEKEN